MNTFTTTLNRYSLRAITVLASLLLAIQMPDYVQADEGDWTQRKVKDGVSIYSRPVAGSKYEEFKGVVELDVTQASALALLDDVSSCKEWLHRCKSSVILEQIDDQQRYVYQISSLPFPAASRDSIFLARVTQQDIDTIRIELQAVPEYIEETKHIRIRIAKGHYLIKRMGDKRIRLTWKQHVDPAGALPAFMVNSMLTDLPFKSLTSFKKLVATKKYQDAIFVYDEAGIRTGLIY